MRPDIYSGLLEALVKGCKKKTISKEEKELIRNMGKNNYTGEVFMVIKNYGIKGGLSNFITKMN